MKPRHMMRTARYSKGWKRGSTGIGSTGVMIRREGQAIPATFVRPVGARKRLPCWIAIGGVSLKGRFHPQLVRFAEALASTGAGVLVPGLPEWRRLSVCPPDGPSVGRIPEQPDRRAAERLRRDRLLVRRRWGRARGLR